MTATSPGDWDLTPLFPAPASAEYEAFMAALRADLTALLEDANRLGAVSESSAPGWAELLVKLEDADARLTHVECYLVCRRAADGSDEWTRIQLAKLDVDKASAEKAFVVVRAALGEADGGAFEALVSRAELEDVAYFLTRLRTAARYAMPAKEEALAADLGTDGLHAWGRLYATVASSLSFQLEAGGEEVPVSMTRSLLESPDERIREAALRGANGAWAKVGETMAACLNAIAGARHTLADRRGHVDVLDPYLFDHGIRRETLDTLLDVVATRRPLAWRYYRLKAGVLGRDRLRFCDTMAPFPSQNAPSISWDQAVTIVLDAFGRFSPALQDLARTAVEQRWIDHQPRPNKGPGAFCFTSPVLGESRVFMTFNRTSGDVQTLAHELGHAFHGAVMRPMRYWATRYPMTLAETASTFAEAVVGEALASSPTLSRPQRLALLDSKLSDAAVFLCNTPMRFVFERAFYQERRGGEVGVSRLCELMLAAQRECYGDSLDPESLDPWFWASKLHFYLTDVGFYNFPYTFGYLFSLGLYAQSLREGPSFITTYEGLLRNAASGPVEEVVQNALGVDLAARDFWEASLDLVESDLARFERELEL